MDLSSGSCKQETSGNQGQCGKLTRHEPSDRVIPHPLELARLLMLQSQRSTNVSNACQDASEVEGQAVC